MTILQDNVAVSRPVLLIGHPTAEYADLVCRYFDGRGWETHQATSGREVRAKARELSPDVIVLGTNLPDESGWLICEKLQQERSGRRVVLVAERWTTDYQHFADFVRASAVVHEEAGVQALAEAIEDPARVFALT
jgi:CheY-like chemotaxis protein